MTNDLISRKRALKALRETKIKGTRTVKNTLIEVIQELPVAYIYSDQETHGYWVEVGKSKSGLPIWKCSYCGKERAGNQAKSAYCRDCGCPMDFDDFIPGQLTIDI